MPARSVVGRVALALVAAQVVTGLVAVGLTAWLAEGRLRDLAAGRLRVRVEAVADELALRAGTGARLDRLPPDVFADVAARFPDPVALVGPAGTVLARTPDATRTPPPALDADLAAGDVLVETRPEAPGGTWALAPVYDPQGLVVGGVLVQPLDASLAAELAPTRGAYRRALLLVGAVAAVLALGLGLVFARGLVGPLRRITRGVERVGAGDYAARLPETAPGEIGRLAGSVNAMAAEVEQSVATLRAADRMRRDLVANVGHDLRTPLAALRGFVEEAGRHLDAGEPDRARPLLAAATRQTAYLGGLVGDLFELAVLEGAPAPLRREAVPLGELLRDTAEAHGPLMDRAGIRFRTDLAAGLPVLDADGTRLLRLVGNLLDNARAHTPAGGTVTLAARTEPDAAVVTVADTGSGIAPDVLPHLFARYYRGGDARTRRAPGDGDGGNGGGTGLGLAIADAVARLHGGTLTAASPPGAGATFTLRLPLAGLPAPGDAAAGHPPSATARPRPPTAGADRLPGAPVSA